MKRNLIIVAFSVLLSVSLSAAPKEFDFKDPKGVNNIVFKLDAPLEAINGTATGISGKVTFDPDNPADLKGTLILETSSLHVGNPTMKQHLHSDKWMDVAKFPQIKFEALKAKNVKSAGNVTTTDVEGTMTIKGITKPITIPVKLTYLKDRLKARWPMREGDLLVARSQFAVKRSDFGINPGSFEENVSEEIELNLSLAGGALK